MRLLINTLSVGHLSGRHVVYGFLRELAKTVSSPHELVLLAYEGAPIPAEIQGENVHRVPVSDRMRNWMLRSIWELAELPRLVRRLAADAVFTVSGSITPGLKVPQISLAQNPWCFVRRARSGWRDEFKAQVQLRAYRKAWRDAAMMFFISDHLRGLYRRHAPGIHETRSAIALVGLDDSTHEAAARLRATVTKDPMLILSVSAMAPWKGTETLVSALGLLRDRGLDARLRLVGPWPQPAYRKQIESQIHASRLEDRVTITGHVTRDELHRHYAEAQVFCLMSCCESFGIPAAEAMAFGTPIVSTKDCAIAEICAGAGAFGPIGDATWTADALEAMLSQESDWQAYSRRAVGNAEKLTWPRCAQPLQEIFNLGLGC